jgi:hypothetical protein
MFPAAKNDGHASECLSMIYVGGQNNRAAAHATGAHAQAHLARAGIGQRTFYCRQRALVDSS